VFIFPDAGGILGVEMFYLHSQLNSRDPQGGCSHPKILPLLSRATSLFGKGCLWPEKSQSKATQKSQGPSGVNPLPGTSGRQ